MYVIKGRSYEGAFQSASVLLVKWLECTVLDGNSSGFFCQPLYLFIAMSLLPYCTSPDGTFGYMLISNAATHSPLACSVQPSVSLKPTAKKRGRKRKSEADATSKLESFTPHLFEPPSTYPIFEPSTYPIFESSTYPVSEPSMYPIFEPSTYPIFEPSTYPIFELDYDPFDPVDTAAAENHHNDMCSPLDFPLPDNCMGCLKGDSSNCVGTLNLGQSNLDTTAACGNGCSELKPELMLENIFERDGKLSWNGDHIAVLYREPCDVEEFCELELTTTELVYDPLKEHWSSNLVHACSQKGDLFSEPTYVEGVGNTVGNIPLKAALQEDNEQELEPCPVDELPTKEPVIVKNCSIQLFRLKPRCDPLQHQTVAHSQAVQVEAHSHAVQTEAHSHAVQAEAHSHAVQVEAHSHAVQAEAHSHAVQAEAHSHAVQAEAHSHTVQAEAHSHTVQVEAHSHAVQVEAHSHAVQAEAHSNAVQAEAHSQLQAEAHSHAVKAEAHSQLQAEAHSHAVKAEAHSQAQAEAHSHAVQVEAHSHAVQVEAQPRGQCSEQVTVPKDTRPTVCNQELQRLQPSVMAIGGNGISHGTKTVVTKNCSVPLFKLKLGHSPLHGACGISQYHVRDEAHSGIQRHDQKTIISKLAVATHHYLLRSPAHGK